MCAALSGGITNTLKHATVTGSFQLGKLASSVLNEKGLHFLVVLCSLQTGQFNKYTGQELSLHSIHRSFATD